MTERMSAQQETVEHTSVKGMCAGTGSMIQCVVGPV